MHQPPCLQKKRKSSIYERSIQDVSCYCFYHRLPVLVSGNADSTFSLMHGSKKQHRRIMLPIRWGVRFSITCSSPHHKPQAEALKRALYRGLTLGCQVTLDGHCVCLGHSFPFHKQKHRTWKTERSQTQKATQGTVPLEHDVLKRQIHRDS